MSATPPSPPEKKRFVIIGAGLGGCIAAETLLADGHTVTMIIEEGDGPADVEERGIPPRVMPHVGQGCGGTTRFWHNGLIIPEKSVLENWPVSWETLLPSIRKVMPLLSGATFEDMQAASARLRDDYVAAGIPQAMLGEGLFYPLSRRNLWQSLGLSSRVTVVRGRALPVRDADGPVKNIDVITAAGETRQIDGDVFIVAAGGLATPDILQHVAPLAGCFYEDHPTGFVAEVSLTHDGLYKLWNRNVPDVGAGVRVPLRMDTPHGPVAFYLRPAYQMRSAAKRGRVESAITDVRNHPWRVGGYLRLLSHVNDVLDVLSLKIGLRIKTTRFHLVMVSSQHPDAGVSVGRDTTGKLWRNWHLEDSFFTETEEAVARLTHLLGRHVTDWHMLPDWRETLGTGAHHSGTARMGFSPKDSVCDATGKVWDMTNLFVADGSLIPDSGYANTGLMIAAMATRVATLAAEASEVHVPDHVDIVMTGAGGFLGTRLRPLFEAAGLTVMTWDVFLRHPQVQATTLVHLANVHGNPAANDALMARVLRVAKGRVGRVVLAQTVASLTGPSRFNPARANGGLTPWRVSAYTAGKLLAEDRLTNAVRHGDVAAGLCLYLPSFSDQDSPWDLQLAQAKANGFYWVTKPPKDAGPMVCRVRDVATEILAWHDDGLTRAVMPTPDGPTWEATMTAFHTVNMPAPSRMTRIKAFVWLILESAMGVLWRVGLLRTFCHALWRPYAPVVRRDYTVPAGPVGILPVRQVRA